MDWVRIIQKAIDDIEAELCGDISADVIAEKGHILHYSLLMVNITKRGLERNSFKRY